VCDHESNEKMTITNATVYFIQYCRRNWKENSGRMSCDIVLSNTKYQPTGKRGLGRLLKSHKNMFCNF
jgi:hypothetical protein